MTRRSRTTPEDPRQNYSAEETKEWFIGTAEEGEEEKSDDGWLDTDDVEAADLVIQDVYLRWIRVTTHQASALVTRTTYFVQEPSAM